MTAEDVLQFVFATIETERKKYPSLSLQHMGAKDALDNVKNTLVNFKGVAVKQERMCV